MKIIGHRGARDTELENSLASIQKALEFDLDAIELDIHRTRDDVLVVMHDATTNRTAAEDVPIADATLADLQHIHLRNGQPIPTLDEVLRLADTHPLYIDVKDPGTAPLLAKLLEGYPTAQITVVSRLPGELQRMRSLRSDIPTYMYFLKAENPILRPIHMVSAAQQAQATGLGLDKLIINPLTYWLARHRGLKLYSYAFKSTWGVRVFSHLYPGLDIMTSNPEKINHHTMGASKLQRN